MINFALCSTRLVALGLLMAAGLAFAGASATDDILRLLPADMSGCLIIQDLGKHADLLRGSETFRQFGEKPLVQNWKNSASFKGFENLTAFLPLYFGVSNEQLVHDVLGDSIVLALRLPTNGSSPVGVFACRAAKEEVLVKVLERLTTKGPNRQITPHTYRDVTFHERHEFNGRQDYLLRIGSVAIMTDKQEVIEQIIDTSIDGKSLIDAPLFREMRSSIGEGNFLELLIDTEPFKPLLNQAVEQASGPVEYFAKIFRDVWLDLDWAALSLKITDHLELSLHASVDPKELDSTESKWLAVLSEASNYWKSVPGDVLFAAATQLDATLTCEQFLQLSKVVPELATVVEAFDDLAVGFDATKDLLPALGPEFGTMIRIGEAGTPEVFIELQLAQGDKMGGAGLDIAKTMELVILRPIFVFYSIEHNHEFSDSSRVETTNVGDLRIHSLVHSTVLPDWLIPSFSVSTDRIRFTSSPQLLTQKRSGNIALWIDSPEAKRFRDALGIEEVPKAYLSVNRLREFLVHNQGEIAGNIAEKTSVSSSNASGKINDLNSILELVDFAVLSTTTKGQVRRWTLSAFASQKN